MHKLPIFSFALLISCSSWAGAQDPAGKEAAPLAKGEPAAGPSRDAVEKYVTELKSLQRLEAQGRDHAAKWLESQPVAK